MAPAITIATLSRAITTEAQAYAYLESLRWGDAPRCSHCESENVYLINCATNGVSRATRTGNMSQRRVWKCRTCKRQFSVLTGTIMHGTKLPVRHWVMVIFEMCSSKNGVAAKEIERKYGIAGRSAWFMLHRVRQAMQADGTFKMTGTVVADETWIGGDPKNRHASRQDVTSRFAPVRLVPGERGGCSEKVPVLSLINAETGEVRSVVVPDVTGRTLRKVIAEHVEMGVSVLHTDSAPAYRAIGREFAEHESVNHEAGEYVRGNVSTNKAENFFSQLKRSIDGTHHHVSEEHLHRYLAEFGFRYGTRKLSDADRMALLLGQRFERRLTYKRTVRAAA